MIKANCLRKIDMVLLHSEADSTKSVKCFDQDETRKISMKTGSFVGH